MSYFIDFTIPIYTFLEHDAEIQSQPKTVDSID